MKGMTRCVLKHKRYCHIRNVVGLFSIGTRGKDQMVNALRKDEFLLIIQTYFLMIT